MILLFTLWLFATSEEPQTEPDSQCAEQSWLCEEKPCPSNEEKVENFCQCKTGFERKPASDTCEPLL